ncbi:MAG: enoyl-CoA hydratase-related protein [Marinobacter sp.]|nr:enoyl-CoA hydratase-related protein [Marinobacter sp.]
MTTSSVDSRTDHRGVTVITLNRPDKRNAFDDRIISELTAALNDAAADPACRVVVLAGAGRHFSAGADLGYMQRTAELSREENIEDARRLARLMQVLDQLAVPTVARVQGAAFGGAIGLICACDVAIGADNARLCLSEARLGITPAAIGPYVVRAMGPRQARRYFQSAEEIPAQQAVDLGLLHEQIPESELDERVEALVATLLRNGPVAMAAGKALVDRIAGTGNDPSLIEHTANVIADLRTGPEGQEGLQAFFEKRSPKWAVTS